MHLWEIQECESVGIYENIYFSGGNKFLFAISPRFSQLLFTRSLFIINTQIFFIYICIDKQNMVYIPLND